MSPRARRAVLLQNGLPALVLLLAFDSAGKASADHDAELTQVEQRRLEAGERVTRPARKRSGPLDLIGGVSWQVIDAAPAVVWRAIHDVARYPKMVPGVIEARAQSVSDTQRSVFIRQGAWPVIGSYNVLMRSDPSHSSSTRGIRTTSSPAGASFGSPRTASAR